MENKKKKRYGIIAALLLLVLAAGVGTYAWLSADQTLHNEFTVGSFSVPDKKPDETDPTTPGNQDNVDKAYLFETKWNKGETHKMVPGSSMEKNPNVGIGKGSDDAYVFIYVKNAVVNDNAPYAKTPCFELGPNWKAVTEETKQNADNKYVSGLFMYSKGAEAVPSVLDANADQDVYTGELFKEVMIPGAMTKEDVVSGKAKPEIVVSAFIFGADQTNGSTSAADNAIAQAKAWAHDPNNHLE